MSRESGDEMRDGVVYNGFDYDLQVWVQDGIVVACGHPASMSRQGACCNQRRFAGRPLANILADRT